MIRTDGELRRTLSVGDRGRLTKIMSEEDVEAFADASGDYNPVHLDEGYARETVFGKRVVHGVLTAGLISAVLGGVIPGLGTIFCEMHLKFLKPVFIGDEIAVHMKVLETLPEKNRIRLETNCLNQKGEMVLTGEAVVMPPD